MTAPVLNARASPVKWRIKLVLFVLLPRTCTSAARRSNACRSSWMRRRLHARGPGRGAGGAGEEEGCGRR
eukprot:4370555-Pyramimonas_sp.AAC.1